ncbi:hypothetical protein JCM13580A_62130 [Streptomyces drozdowiczii]|uniref:discoidin domain-containing protein n=1 Tax=Streptomyces drozdowiczii TaxID=202862 RepID=UPI0031EC55C2
MTAGQLHVIDGCYVTDSSGCHRYDFWNEQALFDGSPHTGWGSLSRNAPQAEYLEIDLGSVRTPVKIRLQRRAVPVIRTGFPGTVRVIAYPEQGGEKTVLVADPISVEAGEWFEGDLEPIATRKIRVETDGVEIRPSGKFFTQIMQMQFLEA